MKAIICLTTFLILLLTLEWKTAAASEECSECNPTLLEIYDEEKRTIEELLDETPTGFVLTDFFDNFKTVGTVDEKNALTSLINEMKDSILGNDSFSNQQKLAKAAMVIDKFFLHYPAMEDTIGYEYIGGQDGWGPLCDLLFIVDEYNIPQFWELVATPGTVTPCRLYDVILAASKDNYIIQRGLYVQNIDCSKSFDAVLDVLGIHEDIPFEDDQLYLKSLDLDGYDMTLNQVQRVAQAYYSSGAVSCRRLKDMFANFAASNFWTGDKITLNGILYSMSTALTAEKTNQFCVSWFSWQVAKAIAENPNNVKLFAKIFWNEPYGSFYHNIVFNHCQISALKKYAPEYYA